MRQPRGHEPVRAVLGPRPFAALAQLAPPVVVACSGGADSLALLALAVAADLDPVAVHVDHGLRPGSAAEADLVAAAARRLGARTSPRAVHVAPGPSLEARARDARYLALDDARRTLGATAVLVGHTRDDQAETVLLNILRGAATTGLGGMPARRGHLVRPLLDVPRATTLELCARLQLDPFVDPMNADLRHQRVWVRRELLPMLEATARRDLRVVLARQAAVLREESEFLDRLGSELLDEGVLSPSRLGSAEPVVARRAVRQWLGSPPASFDVVDAVLDLAGSGSVNLPGGDRVVVRNGRLVRVTDHRRNRSLPTPAATTPVTLTLPGAGEGLGVRVESWVERATPVAWPDGRWTCVVDGDTVGPSVVLRPPRTGERFRPLGLAGTKTVSDALAESGVPPRGRATAPVLARLDGDALWVVGYRIDARARVTARTRRFLWITADLTFDLGGPPR